MRNDQTAFVSVVLFTLFGCGAAEGEFERESVAQAALDTSQIGTHRFDEATQSFVFDAPPGTSWVDLHVSINSGRQANVRMSRDGDSFRAGPLIVRASDRISYSLTHFTNGQATDSEPTEVIMPQSLVPLALRSEIVNYSTGYEFQLLSALPLAWADVHYTINGGIQQNVRMSGSAMLAHSIALKPDDTLSYSVTYAADSFVFDSPWQTYRPSARRRFVVGASADSTTGTCIADATSGSACNLRAAVHAAQKIGGSVTIELGVDSTVSEGLITISAPATAQNLHLVIEPKRGTGPKLISGANASQLFGIEASATLSLRNVVVTNFAPYASGSAIWNSGNLELYQTTVRNSRVACFGTGAMTAFAYCAGGAITNYGKLSIGPDSRFEGNVVDALASTASFTNSGANGGAIATYGTLLIRPPVVFAGNSAVARSQSGIHPMPGGAFANASGGALYNVGGTLIIADGGSGSCKFTSNSASATANAISPHPSTADSSGGAIHSIGGTLRVAHDCEFSNNMALRAPDIDAASDTPN